MLKRFFSIDLQAWEIDIILGFVPNLNIHKNIDCHLKI